MNLEKYCYQFCHLRQGSTKYGVAPHKLIMLLAVIEQFDAGNIILNRIDISEPLLRSFNDIWNSHIITGHCQNFALPFFHLKNDGFWHLHTFAPMQYSSISALGVLRKTIAYVTIDDDLFNLFTCANSRQVLREVLLKKLKDHGYQPIAPVCPFCEISSDTTIIRENKLAIAFYDKFPVSEGHTLIIPKRHIANYFHLNQDELADINELNFYCKELLQNKYSPDGFNLGVNIGEAAGQTIFHCHIHLIPRYYGDTPTPKGGVRGVIPAKQSY